MVGHFRESREAYDVEVHVTNIVHERNSNSIANRRREYDVRFAVCCHCLRRLCDAAVTRCDVKLLTLRSIATIDDGSNIHTCATRACAHLLPFDRNSENADKSQVWMRAGGDPPM